MKALLDVIICVLLFIFIWRQSMCFYQRQVAIKQMRTRKKQKQK